MYIWFCIYFKDLQSLSCWPTGVTTVLESIPLGCEADQTQLLCSPSTLMKTDIVAKTMRNLEQSEHEQLELALESEAKKDMGRSPSKTCYP